jgi:hypothetical protein
MSRISSLRAVFRPAFPLRLPVSVLPTATRLGPVPGHPRLCTVLAPRTDPVAGAMVAAMHRRARLGLPAMTSRAPLQPSPSTSSSSSSSSSFSRGRGPLGGSPAAAPIASHATRALTKPVATGFSSITSPCGRLAPSSSPTSASGGQTASAGPPAPASGATPAPPSPGLSEPVNLGFGPVRISQRQVPRDAPRGTTALQVTQRTIEDGKRTGKNYFKKLCQLYLISTTLVELYNYLFKDTDGEKPRKRITELTDERVAATARPAVDIIGGAFKEKFLYGGGPVGRVIEAIDNIRCPEVDAYGALIEQAVRIATDPGRFIERMRQTVSRKVDEAMEKATLLGIWKHMGFTLNVFAVWDAYDHAHQKIVQAQRAIVEGEQNVRDYVAATRDYYKWVRSKELIGECLAILASAVATNEVIKEPLRRLLAPPIAGGLGTVLPTIGKPVILQCVRFLVGGIPGLTLGCLAAYGLYRKSIAEIEQETARIIVESERAFTAGPGTTFSPLNELGITPTPSLQARIDALRSTAAPPAPSSTGASPPGAPGSPVPPASLSSVGSPSSLSSGQTGVLA